MFCLVVTPPCGYWIKSSMTDRSGNDGRLSRLPLWIADQVRNDVTSCPAVTALWIPAYAGMTVRDAWNDGRPAPSLWIADQVRNDVTSCPAVTALWIPAYAGMTVRDAWNDGRPAPSLWIADQVRNDVGVVAGRHRPVDSRLRGTSLRHGRSQ